MRKMETVTLDATDTRYVGYAIETMPTGALFGFLTCRNGSMDCYSMGVSRERVEQNLKDAYAFYKRTGKGPAYGDLPGHMSEEAMRAFRQKNGRMPEYGEVG